MAREDREVETFSLSLGRPQAQALGAGAEPELRPLSIKANAYDDLEEVFPSFWLNIPTPFRRGDIVWTHPDSWDSP